MAMTTFRSVHWWILTLAVLQEPQGAPPKVEVPLPAGQGKARDPEIRVMLHWNSERGQIVRAFGAKVVGSDEELRTLIKTASAQLAVEGHPDVPVVIDAAAAVPWRDVEALVGMCRELKVKRVEFAPGTARRDPASRPHGALSAPASRPASQAAESRPAPVALVIRHRDGGRNLPCEEFAKGGNCDAEAHWVCEILGTEYPWDLLGARLQKLARQSPQAGAPGRSAATVSIRSDASTPYLLVQKVMAACGAAGIHSIELDAGKSERPR